MPIYEYRCPNGHTFERFQSMTAPAPEKCDVCGAAPLELVLYPIAIHYKGSGFYSTDYGKGGHAKKEGATRSSESGLLVGRSMSETKTDSKPAGRTKQSGSRKSGD